MKGEFEGVQLRTIKRSIVDKAISKGLAIKDISDSTEEGRKKLDDMSPAIEEELAVKQGILIFLEQMNLD